MSTKFALKLFHKALAPYETAFCISEMMGTETFNSNAQSKEMRTFGNEWVPMKKALHATSIAMLLLLSACAANPEPSPTATLADKTEIIAEAEVDYDHNGEIEKLYVRMIKGERKEEKEPGPVMGPYWEGEFRLELAAQDGSLLHTLDLNETFGGGPLLFADNREFNIDFEDYNNDGWPDFSIGQYLSSNGFTYNLYSLTAEGIVVIHHDLFTGDSRYSIVYEKAGNNSFRNRYYDMEKGEYAETLFTWQGERFVRTECEGCGMASGGQ